MTQPSYMWLFLFLSAATDFREWQISPTAQLATMAWLEGKWCGQFGGNRFEATYSSSDGGAMLSMNKESRDGRLRSIEFERFGCDDTGVFLLRYPGGKPKEFKFCLAGYHTDVKRASFLEQG